MAPDQVSVSLYQVHNPKPIPEVSDPDVVRRFWTRVRKTSGCWEWGGGRNHSGYGVFHQNSTNTCSSHRFSFVLHNGEPPESRPFVLHRCDNPPCVRPLHLYAGTAVDNARDALSRGLLVPLRGEACTRSILDDDAVREIVALHTTGLGYDRIARSVGVSKPCVQAVLTGRSWSHITGILPGTVDHSDRRGSGNERSVLTAAGPETDLYRKLNPGELVKLLRMRTHGFSFRALARWFGVSRDCARDATRRYRLGSGDAVETIPRRR